MKRRNAYRGVFRLLATNAQSSIHADNLDALLDSKYKTARFVAQQLFPREASALTNDPAIRAQFAALVQRVDRGEIVAAEDFNEQYLKIVLAGQSPEAGIVLRRVLSMIEGDCSAEEWARCESAFLAGTSQTDLFLRDKLSKDLHKFQPRNQGLLGFLSRNEFVNGWIARVGMAVIGTVVVFSQLG